MPADNLKIGGFSPKAPGLTPGCPSSWYGEAKFALTYDIDDKNAIWGLCLPAPEEKENWQAADDLEEQKEALLDDLKDWPQPIRDTIAGTEKLVKFGLYDRPALDPEHWYHSRCVLVGDAAHPTSPHYGQGANQSLEDCWHLSQLLPDADGDLSTESLTTAFRSYAAKATTENSSVSESRKSTRADASNAWQGSMPTEERKSQADVGGPGGCSREDACVVQGAILIARLRSREYRHSYNSIPCYITTTIDHRSATKSRPLNSHWPQHPLP